MQPSQLPLQASNEFSAMEITPMGTTVMPTMSQVHLEEENRRLSSENQRLTKELNESTTVIQNLMTEIGALQVAATPTRGRERSHTLHSTSAVAMLSDTRRIEMLQSELEHARAQMAEKMCEYEKDRSRDAAMHERVVAMSQERCELVQRELDNLRETVCATSLPT